MGLEIREKKKTNSNCRCFWGKSLGKEKNGRAALSYALFSTVGTSSRSSFLELPAD